MPRKQSKNPLRDPIPTPSTPSIAIDSPIPEDPIPLSQMPAPPSAAPYSTTTTPYTSPFDMDDRFSTTDDQPLNEVARPMYATLDGGKGALETISGHRWLQDRPPPRESASARQTPSMPSTPEPFHGTQMAIERNDTLIQALNMMPTILFERFREYGQIGVLAWCSEFEELVGEIKLLGFSGEMASATRDAASKACRAVLRLDLDIKTNLVIMYLSGQIARLREFLGEDSDDDYPLTNFPMPQDDGYSMYTSTTRGF